MFICGVSQMQDIIDRIDGYAVLRTHVRRTGSHQPGRMCGTAARLWLQQNSSPRRGKSLAQLGAGHACLPEGLVTWCHQKCGTSQQDIGKIGNDWDLDLLLVNLSSWSPVVNKIRCLQRIPLRWRWQVPGALVCLEAMRITIRHGDVSRIQPLFVPAKIDLVSGDAGDGSLESYISSFLSIFWTWEPQQFIQPGDNIIAKNRVGMQRLCQSWIPLRIKQKHPMGKERASRIRLAEMEGANLVNGRSQKTHQHWK